MKKIFLLFLISLYSFGICAEKLEDRYVSRLVSEGLLFFIVPYELPAVQKNKAAEIDITYLIQGDSITLNMSIFTSDIIHADSIQFASTSVKTITQFETFFIDKVGKKFVQRYSCRLPYTYLEEIYRADEPFRMTIYTDEEQLCYGYAAKKWPKEKTWMRQIMLIIRRNQQVQKEQSLHHKQYAS